MHVQDNALTLPQVRHHRRRDQQQAARAGVRGTRISCRATERRFTRLSTDLLVYFAQKLISGRYLGEIMRLVICELIDDGVLFLGQET